jgi:hypothetical protein
MAIKFQNIQQPKPVDPEALVEIVISVPLDAFTVGNALLPSGSIVAGHWLNIGACQPKVAIRGLPKDADVEAVFNSYRKTLTMRRITERKADVPKPERTEAPKAFG